MEHWEENQLNIFVIPLFYRYDTIQMTNLKEPYKNIKY